MRVSPVSTASRATPSTPARSTAPHRIVSVFEWRAKVSGHTVQEEIDNALNNQSIKKFIYPVDIAELVKFLAGKHARTISGQAFPIDGDSNRVVLDRVCPDSSVWSDVW
jgi:NAD(P)-dependent dehydrogenase (short-subunit alcohol dehydrogenase family)